MNAEQGTRISFMMNETEPFEIDGKNKFKPPIKTKITFMKLEDGIHAHIEDFSLPIEMVCSKCVEKYDQIIRIPSAERVFYFEKQRDGDIDEVDTFYMDMKNFTLDITEFLRQEIILHFPMVPVCLKSCKGLCIKCGKNLNKGKCRCKTIEIENKPFAELKKLYKKLSK